MASRHEIVTIDFRANAAKANPAMESLRLAAKDMRTEIEKTEAAIANGKATGMAQAELEKLGITLKAQKKELSSFETAINSLSKGVGALGRAIDAFNAGTLSQMSAAFQKTSYNAAENAKKLLSPNDKDYQKNMAELDALQQKNLENLAKYKLRTEQMLQSIGEGGKISTSDLKQEADGIQELMRLLPHMGQEWMEYYNILQRVNEAVKVQTENEKRLSGAIVDANDARIRASQLTKQGADDAARQRKEAAEEIALRDKNIAKLKEEQKVKQEQVADSAALVQAKDKEIVKQKKIIAGIQERIDNEEKDEKTGRKQIETLNQQADAWVETAKKNKEAVETMKGEVGGLKEQLEGVNAELEKMGTVPTQPAASPAAAPTTPATAAKNEERQAVEQKTEADKKEEQSIKNKTKAEKDETQAVRENTDAKKDEVKVDEQVQEAEKKELKTKDEILKRQDELKVELDALYKEKADYAKQQEKNTAAAKKEAEAVKEEANAYKDLSKEQAEAMLKQKKHPRTTITKGEDGSFSFANAEEAQHFILDSISKMGGYQNGKYSLTSKNKVNQLLAQFGERYGVSGDDTVGAMRGVLKAGGYTSGGVMNPFIGRLEPEVTASYAAYAKEMKDLTAVIEGNTEAKKENTKATDESVKAKRTEAEIDKDIAEKEAESRKLTIQLRKANDGVIESIEEETEKTETLSKAQKKRIDLLKQMLETYKDMSKEEAKAEYTSLTTKSTVGYKGGKLDMSNPEEVQSWLIGQARLISGKKGSGAITLEKGQVDKLLESFSKRYGWTSDSSKAKDLLKQIIQGDTGLFKSGGFADFSGGNLSVTLKQDNDAIEKRITKLQALTAISEGAAEGIEKMTGATKDDTDATKIWANEVERRYNAYMDLQKKVEEMDAAIQVKRKRKSNLPKEGADAQLMRRKIDDDIEDYKKREGYDYTKNQAAALKKSWEGSVKTLSAMMGLPAVEEVKQDTAATDQNTASVERNTQARGRKKKATEEAAAAQQQETKAGEEAVKQEEKLSAEDQKRQELLERKTELEGKIAEKESEIAQKTEDAAGLEQKANNNRDEATRKINELAGAHKKNADDMADESRKLDKLEGEQDGYTKTLDGYRAELAEINKQLDDNAEKRTKAQQKETQSQKLTIDAMNDAIKAMEAENRTIEPQSAKWNENIRVIQQYKAEIERLKNQPVLQMMTERMGNMKNLSADALTETKKFWEQMAAGAERGSQKLAVYEGNLKKIAEEERQRRMEIQKPMRENLNNIGRLSTNNLTETKRYWEAMRDGAEMGTAAYKKAELAVKALANEENRRKANAQAQYINDQMRELNNLSVSGLIEVRRYWEAMAAGAKRGSDEAKDAANALRQINNVEVRTLFGDLSKKNTDEIRAGIEAGKRLISTYESGSPAAERLSKAILDAEEHLKNYGIEAERNARREAAAIEEATKRRKEQDLLMRQQLDQGTSLSESALKTQQQYWQRLIDDPKTAKESLAGYRYELERTIELQEQQADATRDERAAKLGGNLAEMSEGEIREAIEAGKQLIQTYKSASPEAETLAKNIVAAEEHVKQYGVEAQRAAVREAKAVEEANRKRQETNQLMEDQLRRGTGLTESALKQQEQYWQRLADDPKAAAREIAYYFEQLNKVKDIQKQQADTQVKVGGISVLQNMRGDVDYESKISENQRKKDIAALQAYRDALPKEGNVSVLKEIDYYLQQLGRSAKDAAQQTMSLADAEVLAGNLGKQGFSATTTQLQQAKKALVDAQQAAGRGTPRFQQLQEAINKVDLELAKTGEIAQNVQKVLDQPKGQSLNNLKMAVEQGRKALNAMERTTVEGQKAFDELAKKIKDADYEMRQLAGTAKGTANAFEKAWQRFKTYVTFYVSAAAAIQKIIGTFGDLLELSDKMGEVRKTTGFTADEVGRLSDNLAKLDTRTSLTGLMEFSSLAGSIGMKTQEDVQGFTEAANMLAVSLPEMGNEASRTLMKIADATGDLEKNGGNVRETLERVGSTIIALRANSAAAAGPITDFVSRVGAVGAQAGISIDQIAALGATVDALGGRVEMSATALSRMIPAIKNNTFEVAKAIGMTEKELKNMTGMEQMVAIFRKLRDSAKGFDTSTENGMNAMADSVEKALGRSTSMQEVMKELNQQGARAGIVFGLLSQNVDKLEEQLDTASEAYSKNVALMDEYSKMNDTAAGRWARLKNQLEEFFVTAGNTSWLSGLIEKLRYLVDLITDEGPIGGFFRYSLMYLALLKAKWAETFGSMLISIGKFLFATKASTAASAADTAAKTAEAAATEAVGNASADAAVKTGLFAKAWGKMNAAMRANIITAVAMALYFLGSKLIEVAKKSKEAAQRIDMVADAEKKAKEECKAQRAELDLLYKATQDQNKSLEERKKALHDMVGDEKYKQYYEGLANESELAAAAAREYSNLTTEIIKSAKARAYQQKITELANKNVDLETNIDEAQKYVDKNKSSYERVSSNVANSQTAAGMFGMTAAAAQTRNDGRRQFMREYEAKQKDIISNQEEMKKNDEDILRLETKIKDLNLKPQAGDNSNGGGGGGGGNTPYGNFDRVKSNYNEWDANSLVARRKEMLERVKALANGADVQAVLSEDAKFISDAVRKNIKTTKDAIEWYNSERLKIQDALHAKHLTNTGDWMDPKKEKIRKKLMQDDMKAYLEELDAYYTERKTRIDEARNNEDISEAEAWNRNIKNEAEWHKRRAELQIMYSNKHKQIAEDEQDAIAAIVADRTGDDAKYIKATIASTRKFSESIRKMNDQGAKEYRKFQGDLDLGAEKDWNKVEKALTRHLKAIEEIVNKERPFNGIAKNMQEDLGKMGILTADLADGADSAAEELKRITFLLGEAENAYTMTVEKLLEDMRQHGFKEWADVISKDPSMQQGMLAMLRQTFDSVQDAIKKESSIIKKQVEIMMQDITEQVQADTTRLQIMQNSVQRANSLIGAGAASERVADKLAIKQIQLQITLQETRIRMLQKRGADAVALLKQESELLEKQGKIEEAKQKRMDAENVDKSVGLTLTKEQVELDKQRVSLAEKLEESQNRLYTELREWGDLLASSVREVMEASNTGNAEYYNERAKMNLTGKGGPGAGTYVVIDDAGTSDATAHYEYLDEREALERQHEIERENAMAEAWKKVFDDINMKLNETITDQINAMLQNQSIDANTDALGLNTTALQGLSAQIAAGMNVNISGGGMPGGDLGIVDVNNPSPITEQPAATTPVPFTQEGFAMNQEMSWINGPNPAAEAEARKAASDSVLETIIKNKQKEVQVQKDGDQKIGKSSSSTFAKMTSAANLYGIAYQTMADDNMSASQKFQMFALQAAGNAAIAMLTTDLAAGQAKNTVQMPGILGKLLGEMPYPVAIATFAAITALMGGLMGLAVSQVAKSKSQIAQATGAGASAGKLSTGMLTYATGNVNEFTDPDTLTPGRQYNVDAADGRTYRARYMGSNPRTHLTNGPEFHLAGERGREMIIDAGTTRQITMNEGEIWHAIKTLSGGGRMPSTRYRRGVRAFAEGNVDDFEELAEGSGYSSYTSGGITPEMAEQMQASLDRNSEVMEQILANGVHAYFDVYGKGGLVDSYDTGKKTVKRHGERY